MEKKKADNDEVGHGGDDAAVSADLGALILADAAEEEAKAEAEAEAEAEQEVAEDGDDDSSLFNEPPPRPDCDICMLTLPIQNKFHSYMSCCGKVICAGCIATHTLKILETNEKRIEKAKKEKKPPPPLLKRACPFCRTEVHEEGDQNTLDRMQKRVELDDPDTLLQLAFYYRDGDYGLSPDEGKYWDFLEKAASLGSADAHYVLGIAAEDYSSIARAHFEAGAKSGCVPSRHELGEMEYAVGNKKVAVRHWRMSAAAGYNRSVKELIKCFQEGLLSKESLEESIRAKHVACEAIRSEERDKFVEVMKQTGKDLGTYY